MLAKATEPVEPAEPLDRGVVQDFESSDFRTVKDKVHQRRRYKYSTGCVSVFAASAFSYSFSGLALSARAAVSSG
jgi:hypothetical protein